MYKLIFAIIFYSLALPAFAEDTLMQSKYDPSYQTEQFTNNKFNFSDYKTPLEARMALLTLYPINSKAENLLQLLNRMDKSRLTLEQTTTDEIIYRYIKYESSLSYRNDWIIIIEISNKQLKNLDIVSQQTDS